MAPSLRALLICDDVRFEVGGTMTLVGVYADRILVEGGGDEIVLPRLAFFLVIAGLTGASEVTWRETLGRDGDPPGPPLAGGTEPHDPGADEHRFVHLVSPVALGRGGSYRYTLELEIRGERRRFEHRFAVEPAPAPR